MARRPTVCANFVRCSLPGVVQVLTATLPALLTREPMSSPAPSATRYDGNFLVVLKRVRRTPAFTFDSTTSPFERTTAPSGASTVSAQVALNDGSSKLGMARRASAASNWVTTSLSSALYSPRSPWLIFPDQVRC